MRILRTAQELSAYLRSTDCKPGCFADTSFLYGVSYEDDRLFDKANDVLDLLSENSVPIYANVISRLEFVDLILRKQLTTACGALFDELERGPENQELFNLLKNIRDRNTAVLRDRESYKISETQIKKLRKLIVDLTAGTDWQGFCGKYTGALLVSEWKIIEEGLPSPGIRRDHDIEIHFEKFWPSMKIFRDHHRSAKSSKKYTDNKGEHYDARLRSKASWTFCSTNSSRVGACIASLSFAFKSV